MEFEAWPKIPRLRRDFVITEKIDGTNAAVLISRAPGENDCTMVLSEDDDAWFLQCQSRTRLISPHDDNFGFAHWAYAHAETLIADLGEGRHFGEWWGSGIQRGYGLTDKQFSLFNVNRWERAQDEFQTPRMNCVPVIARSEFSSELVDYCVERMAADGSLAAPGFMDPEGVVVYHTQARQLFKVTIKGDEKPKGSNE